jgi:hypothetical protein
MARKGFKIVKDRKTELYIGFQVALKKFRLIIFFSTKDFYKDIGLLRHYEPNVGPQVEKAGPPLW